MLGIPACLAMGLAVTKLTLGTGCHDIGNCHVKSCHLSCKSKTTFNCMIMMYLLNAMQASCRVSALTICNADVSNTGTTVLLSQSNII